MATVFYRGFYRKIENLRLQCAWSGEVTGKNSKTCLKSFRLDTRHDILSNLAGCHFHVNYDVCPQGPMLPITFRCCLVICLISFCVFFFWRQDRSGSCSDVMLSNSIDEVRDKLVLHPSSPMHFWQRQAYFFHLLNILNILVKYLV